MSKSEKAVERRTVLLAGGAAATVVLSGCVVQRAPVASPPAQVPSAPGTQPASTAPRTRPATTAPPQPPPNPLAKVADIPAGGGVILKDKNVVLTKDQSGKVGAFSAICTHQGCSVTAVEGGTINCPCHGSKFDATTGEPVAGPAQKPLPAVAFQQRDGAIFQA